MGSDVFDTPLHAKRAMMLAEMLKHELNASTDLKIRLGGGIGCHLYLSAKTGELRSFLEVDELTISIDFVSIQTYEGHGAGSGWKFDFGSYSHVYPGVPTIVEIEELVAHVFPKEATKEANQ